MEARDRCQLCERSGIDVTRHHLIPRTRHRNRRNKKTFERSEVHERIAWLCRACHKQVHTLIDEKTLETEYNTLEALRAHDGLTRFVAWVRERPEELKVRSYRKYSPKRRRR